MYARVGITTQIKKETLVVPSTPSSISAAGAACFSTERHGRLPDRGARHQSRDARRSARWAHRRRSGDHDRCAGAARRRSHPALRRRTGGRGRRGGRPAGRLLGTGARAAKPRRGRCARSRTSGPSARARWRGTLRSGSYTAAKARRGREGTSGGRRGDGSSPSGSRDRPRRASRDERHVPTVRWHQSVAVGGVPEGSAVCRSRQAMTEC